MTGDGGRAEADTKRALRADLLAGRRVLPMRVRRSAANALRDVLLATPEVQGAATVAAYVSIGTEPPTAPLLGALLSRGARLLLPVLLPDHDVDWAEYKGPGSLAPTSRGLLEPVGAHLGVDAVTDADAVLVPGLAVDRSGVRLGRGGGSYDRVLARVSPDLFTAVLLYDHEVVDAVPYAEHDRHVRAAATPSGLLRFPSEEER